MSDPQQESREERAFYLWKEENCPEGLTEEQEWQLWEQHKKSYDL